MSDAKISALPASTTPLAGTEVLPIVQSGATKQVSVTNLTAGRAVSVLSLTSTNGATIQSLTVGRGAGAVATNTAVGLSALDSNTTGLANDSFGYLSLFSNTTANENVGFGYQTLYSATTGGTNTALGSAAVRSVVDGSGNTGAGYRSLYATTGSNNTALGYNAGTTATTGSNNGFFGYNAQPSAVDVSNEYTYGNASVTKHRFVGGDIVIGTAGKGIDFSADGQAAGMTSELLDDYEEGTWTPADNSGDGLVFTAVTGHYTKIGRCVTAALSVTYPATASTANARISLPFTSGTGDGATGFYMTVTTSGLSSTGITVGSFLQFYDNVANIRTNVNFSGALIRGVVVYYI
jgi:hypothetical protein